VRHHHRVDALKVSPCRCNAVNDRLSVAIPCRLPNVSSSIFPGDDDHLPWSQDISLAKSLSAFSPVSQQKTPIANLEGVDIILGGHDHMYFVSKGVTEWEGFDTSQPVLGAEDDEGDVLVLKSGCDFRDLSEITLELESTAAGNVRKKVIKSITGLYNCLWHFID
jgi:hypothetical protein